MRASEEGISKEEVERTVVIADRVANACGLVLEGGLERCASHLEESGVLTGAFMAIAEVFIDQLDGQIVQPITLREAFLHFAAEVIDDAIRQNKEAPCGTGMPDSDPDVD